MLQQATLGGSRRSPLPGDSLQGDVGNPLSQLEERGDEGGMLRIRASTERNSASEVWISFSPLKLFSSCSLLPSSEMSVKSAINKEVFIPHDEKMLVAAQVKRRTKKKIPFLATGGQGDYMTFICISGSLQQEELYYRETSGTLKQGARMNTRTTTPGS
ncbi:hypothetical protein NQZ68_017393 [Dissostichus eleginoides]|nr:hypothetical protein NQZ68_017393 [Dissostichus eleginoides]